MCVCVCVYREREECIVHSFFMRLRSIEIFRGTQEMFRKFRNLNKKLIVNYVTSYQSFKIRSV